jgi:hypothetical protein
MSLGKFQFTTKTWIILFIVIITVIVLVVAASNSGSSKPVVKPNPTPTLNPNPTPTPAPTTLSFTVKAGAGILTVLVTNQNSGAKITLTPQDLPASFNFKTGDTLTFKVNANEGYIFNAWIFGDGTFQSQNPYSIKASGSFTMEAKFLMVTP